MSRKRSSSMQNKLSCKIEQRYFFFWLRRAASRWRERSQSN